MIQSPPINPTVYPKQKTIIQIGINHHTQIMYEPPYSIRSSSYPQYRKISEVNVYHATLNVFAPYLSIALLEIAPF